MKYTWKDIVKVKGEIHAEEFEIDGEMDGDAYRIDDFMCSVARKYGVDTDDVETYMMDDIEFDATKLPFGAEDCGCYINGIAEWHIDNIEDIKTSSKLIKIKVNRKQIDEWLKSDYIPKENEIICYGGGLFKLGDGKTKFVDLPAVTMHYAFKEGYIYAGDKMIQIEL